MQTIWTLEGDAGPEPHAEAIVPDGCMELVLHFTRSFFDAATNDARPSALLVGAIREPVSVVTSGTIDVLGIRVTPVGCRTIFGTLPKEVVDRQWSAIDVAGPALRNLIVSIESAAPPDRVPLLERGLFELVCRTRHLDPLAQRAVRSMETVFGVFDVAKFANEAGLSARQFERRFDESVGISPKSLATVLRFRNVLRALELRSPNWTHVAASHGYFDQSHLIRDFRRYTGTTPQKFLGAGHPMSDLFLTH